MSLFVGIDLGTTFFKAAVFSREGKLLGLGRAPLEKYESADRCESPADAFWELLRQIVQEALQHAGVAPEDISALAYSSQANSFVLLDAAGECLTPLILWPDRRAQSIVEHGACLRSQEELLAIAGLGLDGCESCYYKLEWLRQREPHIWSQVRFVQTISDYLVFGLTGKRLGDMSTASLTGMWDQQKECWWPQPLERLGISIDALSKPLRTGSLVGPLSETGARRIGLTPGTLLASGALDHYMAALGAGIGSLAGVCESTGTVLACIALSKQFQPQPASCVGPAIVQGEYYRLAFNDTGTSNLDWYQKNCAPELSIPELIRLAEDVPPGSLGLRAEPDLKGTTLDTNFKNMAPSHQHGHFVRAIIEGNALALSHLIKKLHPGPMPAQILATGGGARSETWLQLKADLLGMDVLKVDCEEPACQGAAMIAAVAAGCISSMEEASTLFHRIQQRFHPNPMQHALYREEFVLTSPLENETRQENES